ncbi:MAG: alpha/beta fold hydrolase [Myxococcota bacterium]|nr:hypothetical protein [Deltaproteobacteria bacterium]MDQ3338194.1 alpha/beta fold hydrolase [Myxococcota bacterium]
MKTLLGCLAATALGCGSDDPALTQIQGCDGAVLRANPEDPALRGPWTVGAKTITIGRLRTEVWYPAAPVAGLPPHRYDIRASLNPSQRALVPDADNPWQTCDCFADVPIDPEHGPFPVIVFVHGTASFRHQSLHQTTHWASRGFVVIAADHPGLMLGDLLAQFCPDEPSGAQNLTADIDAILAAIAAPTGELGFLAGKIDPARVGIVGHSAGGSAAARAAGKPGVRVVASLAGNASAPAMPGLERVLFVGGKSDTVVSFGQVSTAWSGSATPSHLVGITQAGHLVFSDLCETKNPAGNNLLAVATQYGLCGASLAGMLFDCDPTYLAAQRGWDITNYATSAVFEPALQCTTTTRSIASIETAYPEVDPFMEK